MWASLAIHTMVCGLPVTTKWHREGEGIVTGRDSKEVDTSTDGSSDGNLIVPPRSRPNRVKMTWLCCLLSGNDARLTNGGVSS